MSERPGRSQFRRWAAVIALAVALAAHPGRAATPTPAGSPGAAVRRFALVIGANDAGRRELAPLHYADDDAIRNAEVLQAAGAEVVLLTTPDEETRALFPQASAVAQAATRAHVLLSVAELFRKVAAARAGGHPTDFYLFFAGHGGLAESGEGALYLPDGALTRRDLYDVILAGSPADFNHLVIDACHAYFFVSSRGETKDIDRRLEERARLYLDAQTLDRYPNTGVVVATSSADTTLEWSDYQGGVISHEVRSALLGAADVNNDRAITYDEVAAFIAAANARVVHARARLKVFVRPPVRAARRPLIEWQGEPMAWLSVSRSVAGHLWIEDERGVRLSEANKSADQPMRLMLLRRQRYFVRLGADEYGFTAQPGQGINFAELIAAPPHASERGSVSEALREGLFATPFGVAFYDAYQRQLVGATEPTGVSMVTTTPDEAAPGPSRKAIYGLLAGAAIAAGAAVALRVASDHAYDDFRAATDPAQQRHWADRTHQLDWATLVSGVVAGACAGVAVGLYVRSALAESHVGVAFTGTTVQAQIRF